MGNTCGCGDPTKEKNELKIEDLGKGAIDQIWATYDADNNGYLDKKEMRKFI